MAPGKGYTKLDAATIAEIQRLYHEERLSLRKIADKLGRDFGTVHRWASGNGSIPLRPRGGQPGKPRPRTTGLDGMAAEQAEWESDEI